MPAAQNDSSSQHVHTAHATPVVDADERFDDDGAFLPPSSPPPHFDDDDLDPDADVQLGTDDHSSNEQDEDKENRQVPRASQLRRSHVFEVPVGGLVPDAEDLFSSQVVATRPRQSVHPMELRPRPAAARSPPTSPSKRHREPQPERDSDDERPSPRKRRAQDWESEKSTSSQSSVQNLDFEEELSQLSLKTPKRSNRRKNVVLSQADDEVWTRICHELVSDLELICIPEPCS